MESTWKQLGDLPLLLNEFEILRFPAIVGISVWRVVNFDTEIYKDLGIHLVLLFLDAMLCQCIFGHSSLSLLPQGCILYIHSPSCSQVAPLILFQFCVLSLRIASSKLFRGIPSIILYHEWITLFSLSNPLSCCWMTPWSTECCKCCFKINPILPV